MKVFKFLLWGLIILGFNVYSCEIKDNTKLYSLSSSITMLLEELNLLESKKLLGISIFHPVRKYNGKKLAGGIFLSDKLFENNPNLIVFYDESRELRKKLNRHSTLKAVEVITRELDAFEAYVLSLNLLKPILDNCSKELEKIENKVTKVKNKIKSVKPDLKYLFYLNLFQSNLKKPELLIVNDGFVKTLIKYSKLKTYNSELGYVSWSSKEMKKFKDKTIHIGISDSKKENIQIERLEKNIWNISYRGALSPGLRQVYFLNHLVEYLQ